MESVRKSLHSITKPARLRSSCLAGSTRIARPSGTDSSPSWPSPWLMVIVAWVYYISHISKFNYV
jgi:hypothetical protein